MFRLSNCHQILVGGWDWRDENWLVRVEVLWKNIGAVICRRTWQMLGSKESPADKVYASFVLSYKKTEKCLSSANSQASWLRYAMLLRQFHHDRCSRSTFHLKVGNYRTSFLASTDASRWRRYVTSMTCNTVLVNAGGYACLRLSTVYGSLLSVYSKRCMARHESGFVDA